MDWSHSLASARRLYHHVLHGGAVKPRDIERLVDTMERMEREIVALEAELDALEK